MFGTAAMRDVFSDDRRFTSWLETEAAPAKVRSADSWLNRPAFTVSSRHGHGL
jgi:adenylosuccinate lyase